MPVFMTKHALLFLLPALFGFTQCNTSGNHTLDSAAPMDGYEEDGAEESAVDACVPIRAVECGEQLEGNTADWNAGATDVMDHYPLAVGNYAAPEATYVFSATESKVVSFALVEPNPSTLNHDLFVLDASLGCRPQANVAAGFNTVTFDAVEGHSYYLVVDGYDDAAGPFEARVDCTSSSSSTDDPFADLPDTDGGLVNVSQSLGAVLEDGALRGACGRWSGDSVDRTEMLLCGKEMFFYEGFGSMGVPAAIFDFMSTKLSDTLGPSFSAYGLVPDPYSTEGRPLGFPDGGLFNGHDTVSWGCASCHFGQLPDGRYAVGYANQEYAYGTHNLSLLLAAQAANPLFDAGEFEPTALAAVQDVIDRITGDWWLRTQFVTALIPLVGGLGDVPGLTLEQQAQYASWAPGVLDAMVAPMPLDDGVAIPARIKDLWSIPGAEERSAWGLEDAHLGWNGDGPNLLVFLQTFIDLADGDQASWPEARLLPLVEYILSLRPPENPQVLNSVDVARGEALFSDAGCADCHDGPRGLGLERVTYEEIGTDDAYRYLLDPDMTGTQFDLPSPLNHMLAPTRLTGLWTKNWFLHNGSVQGLDELLCVDGPRPVSLEYGFGNQGHEQGCDLADEDKDALIAFLLTL